MQSNPIEFIRVTLRHSEKVLASIGDCTRPWLPPALRPPHDDALGTVAAPFCPVYITPVIAITILICMGLATWRFGLRRSSSLPSSPHLAKPSSQTAHRGQPRRPQACPPPFVSGPVSRTQLALCRVLLYTGTSSTMKSFSSLLGAAWGGGGMTAKQQYEPVAKSRQKLQGYYDLTLVSMCRGLPTGACASGAGVQAHVVPEHRMLPYQVAVQSYQHRPSPIRDGPPHCHPSKVLPALYAHTDRASGGHDPCRGRG